MHTTGQCGSGDTGGVIKYIGSKRRMLPAIVAAIDELTGPCTVLDLFSGSARVAKALKAAGHRVVANDMTRYAEVLARAHVVADRATWQDAIERLVPELAAAPPRDGWFTETYARASRYLQPANAARIEGIREAIRERDLPPVLEALALAALVQAADRVDSTAGVQMAYLKAWSARSAKPLHLKAPDLLPPSALGPAEAHGLDALEAVERLEADVAYLDPPYNQHSYLGNYHLWETLVRGDEPATYGVACKRIDVRSRTSPFNRRSTMRAAFTQVVDRVRARALVVSFSDEGFLERSALLGILTRRGPVRVASWDQARYVGARIGIHNPAGERVGTPGRLVHRESLYIVEPCAPPRVPTPAPAGTQGKP